MAVRGVLVPVGVGVAVPGAAVEVLVAVGVGVPGSMVAVAVGVGVTVGGMLVGVLVLVIGDPTWIVPGVQDAWSAIPF